MIVTDGSTRYQWTENWAKTPDTPATRENGRTHGVAVAKDGHVFVFHQSTPALLEYDASGALVGSYSTDFPRAHGLTLVAEGAAEYLWLTDEASGLVAKVTLEGEVVQRIERPGLPIYPEKRYSPTWVAVNPANGDVWVADGYGSSYVHRYAKDGRYLASINGEEGAAGAFRCPHAIYFDTRRGGEPELYVADRANRRIQVYDTAGVYKRAFGQEFLIHPCAFAAHGEKLYVPELFGRMAVLDGEDKFIGYVGENKPVVAAAHGGWPGGKIEGWPNLPRERVQAGEFNAPHGVGTGPDGAVYVVEWYHPGGRIIKLSPQA